MKDKLLTLLLWPLAALLTLWDIVTDDGSREEEEE